MITPEYMLKAIRHDFATRVLPVVEDDRAKSSVIAAMGILGDLALQVAEDTSWARDSAEALDAGARRWRDALGDDWPAEPGGHGEDADPVQRRHEQLAALERLVARLWREGGSVELLRDVRRVLYADLQLQLKRIR